MEKGNNKINNCILTPSYLQKSKKILFYVECFQYLNSAAKQKVPSKFHYNKTGGGEKQDEDCIDQADEQLLDILGHTAIHSHETVTERTCRVSFLSDNDIVTNISDIEEMIPLNMPTEEEEDDSNLGFIIVSVDSNNIDEPDGTEKAM